MLAFVRAYEHHDDRHCPAEAKANHGRTHLQAAVTLLVAFIIHDSLLPQESESRLDYAFSHLFYFLDIRLGRFLHSTSDKGSRYSQIFRNNHHSFPKQRSINMTPAGNKSSASSAKFSTLRKLFTKRTARPPLPTQHSQEKSDNNVISNALFTGVSPL